MEDDEELKETLEAAEKNVVETTEKMNEKELQEFYKSQMPEYSKMSQKELSGNITSSWKEIQDLKKKQEKLKKSQQNVVDHLVDTNEWLFNALNEILEEKV